MLIRKKLAALPVTKLPKGLKADQYDDYYAAAAIHTVGKDEIIVIDIYTLKRKLFCRFFSDKKGYITLKTGADGSEEWYPRHKLSSILGDNGIYSYYTPHCKTSEQEYKTACDYFGKRYDSYYGCKSAVAVAAEWQDRLVSNKRWAAKEREQELQKERLSWFTNENDIKQYVDRLMPNYAFMSHSTKKERLVHCTLCGEVFTVSSNAFRHKERGLCGCCSREVTYFKAQYKSSIADKIKLCEIQKHEDRILIRWETVTKKYGSQPQYIIDPSYWFISKPGKYSERAWSYKKIRQYGGERITSDKHRKPYDDEYYLFYENISEAAGAELYLEQIFKDTPMKFNIFKLIDNYSEHPQMEYLLKMGLPALASLPEIIPKEAKSFTDITGVSKQYLPLYRRYNVTPKENELIKSLNFFVKDEMMEKIRSIDFSAENFKNLRDVALEGKFGDMKIINYIYRYKQKGAAARIYTAPFMTEYRDYVSMLTQLGLQRLTKSDYLPADLTAEHDRLAACINKVKNESLIKDFDTALPIIYKNIPTEFSNDKYCIVLPKAPEDFTREGQALDICVGGQSYINRHMQGRSLICFIRKTEEPQTPYVCCEIERTFYSVLQVHGYKNDAYKRLPAEVKRFAAEYAEAIRKMQKECINNGEQNNRNKTAAA